MIQLREPVHETDFIKPDSWRSATSIANGVLESIGDTPLVRLNRYLDIAGVELIAKLESANPGGSAKDRPARKMVEHALEAGLIQPGDTVIESTSGNMGIGLAQACRFYGLRLVCVVDPNAQSQNVAIMKALGAEIELVREPINNDFLTARLARVAELQNRIKNSYWTNQYSNLQNPQSHFDGTIREIDIALNGEFDYLFVATSSTGTARGCRDYLESRGRSAAVVAVDAEGSSLFGGKNGRRKIPGLGAGTVPPLAESQKFNRLCRVSDTRCVVGCRRAAKREALLVGGSAGGVLEAVRSLQSELQGKRCVAILHDSGMRYLDTVFSDKWVNETLGLSLDDLKTLVNGNCLERLEVEHS